jgi:hypothetical protein
VLLVIETIERHETHRLSQGRTVIGRDKSCDILVNDHSLSRRHLECVYTHEGLLVRDLGSKNGTFFGDRRITEAHIEPGASVRAGDVWFHFKSEPIVSDETVSWRPDEIRHAEPVSAPEVLTQDIGHLVRGAGDYDEDEELTPASNIPAAGMPPLEDGARLVARGDRWFAVDPASGEEVEIVPRDRAGGMRSDEVTTGIVPGIPGVHAPLPALRTVPYDTSHAARAVPVEQTGWRALFATPRRRIMAGVALFVLVLIATLVAILSREPKVRYMSVAEYLQSADQAMMEFNAGRREEAVRRFTALQKAPMEQKRNLAQILMEAIAADGKALKDFVGNNTDAALSLWDEVAKSRESTQMVKEIALARKSWLQDEEIYLAQANDARRDLDNGNVEAALHKAASVPEGSLSRTKARGVIDDATGVALSVAGEAALKQDWQTAMDTLLAVSEAIPAKRAELEPKIKEYRSFEDERQDLVKATNLSNEQNFPEALALLDTIDTGPYADDARTLARTIRRQDAAERADRLFQAGEGPAALNVLTEAELEQSPLAMRIRSILELRDMYIEAVKSDQFTQAEEALNRILRQEDPATSRYGQEAKRNLDSLPVLIQNASALMVDKADNAVNQRDYVTARKNYDTALLLDPTNVKAREGLKALELSAILDYNKAFAMPKDDPDQVLLLLYDVRDRLPSTNRLHNRAQDDIFRITKQKTEAQGNKPKGE